MLSVEEFGEQIGEVTFQAGNLRATRKDIKVDLEPVNDDLTINTGVHLRDNAIRVEMRLLLDADESRLEALTAATWHLKRKEDKVTDLDEEIISQFCREIAFPRTLTFAFSQAANLARSIDVPVPSLSYELDAALQKVEINPAFSPQGGPQPDDNSNGDEPSAKG